VSPPSHTPNPNRVAAGRRNRAKRGPLTAAGRDRLREAARRNAPWQHSTGPQTPNGKRKVAQNGRSRQRGAVSVRERRREAQLGRLLLVQMVACRRLLLMRM
jgi:hypothetical protein